VSKIYPILEEVLMFIDDKIDVCENFWNTMQKHYKREMLVIEDKINKTNRKSTLWDELTLMVVRGKITPGLSEYFSKEVYDNKVLTKLEENVTIPLGNIEEQLSEHVLNAIETLIHKMGMLRSFAKIREVYSVLGLHESSINSLIDLVNTLYHKFETFLFSVLEAKQDIRNFLAFMNHSIVKLANGAEIENSKSSLNKITVDHERLLSFLKSQKTMYFHSINNFFAKPIGADLEEETI
jgi:hypothetical protein